MPIYVGTASSTSIHSTSVGIGTTTTAGRNAGVGTAIGSMILNMDTGAFESFDGNRWIKTAGGDPISATGGNSSSVTSRPGFKVHIFTSPGTFSVTGASTGTNVDLYANNVGIETVADSILDFSEGNPFSEGSGY